MRTTPAPAPSTSPKAQPLAPMLPKDPQGACQDSDPARQSKHERDGNPTHGSVAYDDESWM